MDQMHIHMLPDEYWYGLCVEDGGQMPIGCYMEYVFPHQDLETVTDQFILGDRLLVAPVLTKGNASASSACPRGFGRTLQAAITRAGAIFACPPIWIPRPICSVWNNGRGYLSFILKA